MDPRNQPMENQHSPATHTDHMAVTPITTHMAHMGDILMGIHMVLMVATKLCEDKIKSKFLLNYLLS